MIRVAEPHRRRGIARSLLACLTTSTRRANVGTLRSLPLEENPAINAFLSATGFEIVDRVEKYEAPIESVAAVTRPIYERMKARGKIPANARVEALQEAARDEVYRLLLANFGFSSQRIAERLRANEYGFSQKLSRVAFLGNQLVGALLVTYQNASAAIDATAVHIRHRHTWVNAALKHATQLALAESGVRRVIFSANSTHHPDTAKLARRTGAVLKRSTVIATLSLR